MATHSNILAWEIPWTDDPGGLQSMGLQRVGYDLVTKSKKGKEESVIIIRAGVKLQVRKPMTFVQDCYQPGFLAFLTTD